MAEHDAEQPTPSVISLLASRFPTLPIADIKQIGESELVGVKETGTEGKPEAMLLTILQLADIKKWTREQVKPLWDVNVLHVAKAFGETMETMTEESYEEHFEHFCQGDYLMLGVLQSDTKEALADPHQLRFAGHALFLQQVLPKSATLPTLEAAFKPPLGAEQSPIRGLFLHGVLANPAFQGSGVASALLKGGLMSAPFGHPPAFVCARTQNPLVLVLLRKMVLPEFTNAMLLPFDGITSDGGILSPAIQRFGLDLAALNDWNTEHFDATKFVFRRLYPEFRIGALNGSPTSRTGPQGQMLRSFMDCDAGDALLAVIVL